MRETVTIPTELFIKLAFNERRSKFVTDGDELYRDRLAVDPDLGEVFRTIDPQEEMVVVHPPKSEFNSDDKYSIVWWKDCWRTSYAKIRHQRALSELSRQEDHLRRDIIEYLAQLIKTMTGLDAVPNGTTTIYSMAEAIVESRNIETAVFYCDTTEPKKTEQQTWLREKFAKLPDKLKHIYIGGFHNMYVKKSNEEKETNAL